MKTFVRKPSVLLKMLGVILLIALILALVILVPSGAMIFSAYAETASTSALVPLPVDQSPGYQADAACYMADGSGYKDASLSVQIEKTRAYDTDILLVHVQIADASQIRTAMAAQYGSTSTTFGSSIAKRYNAVLAINGDFFSMHNDGYLVRQGKQYRNLPDGEDDVLVIDDQGDFHIIQKATSELLANLPYKIINSFSFGPGLVIDGAKSDTLDKQEASPEKLTQRICIAQTGPLCYLCIATEGPENTGSTGLTLEQFAQYVYDQGCVNAYNLDGGGSATVVFNGSKINALSTGKMRQLCDIIYFATAVPTK